LDSRLLEQRLIDAAKSAVKFSHSPHSKFKVGAAVLTGSNRIFGGTNVEFDAYTLTVCAERAALFNAVSAGERKINTVAIVTSRTDFKFPCGLCRQALAEFNPKMKIILVNKNRGIKRITLSKLIPKFFKLSKS
jgi:cytidine deaminase